MLIRFIVLLLLSFSIGACASEHLARDQSSSVPALVDTQSTQRKANQYLAHEHTLTIDTDEESLPNVFERVQEKCATDTTHQCTILDSELSTGQDVSARVRLRIQPEGVPELVELITSLATITRQSTHVEDLAESIRDNTTRTAMLQNYRDKLIQLEQKAAGDIESLIRITSELSTVQSDIEQLTGEHAYLKRRVELDIVTILFASDTNSSFWKPYRVPSLLFQRSCQKV